MCLHIHTQLLLCCAKQAAEGTLPFTCREGGESKRNVFFAVASPMTAEFRGKKRGR